MKLLEPQESSGTLTDFTRVGEVDVAKGVESDAGRGVESEAGTPVKSRVYAVTSRLYPLAPKGVESVGEVGTINQYAGGNLAW